jgi:hypothetical protein
MAVSEWDREYMRRLGRYKADSHREALEAHLARSGRERLEVAFAMMLAGPAFPGMMAREDDPTPLYDRARRLGLYRS